MLETAVNGNVTPVEERFFVYGSICQNLNIPIITELLPGKFKRTHPYVKSIEKSMFWRFKVMNPKIYQESLNPKQKTIIDLYVFDSRDLSIANISHLLRTQDTNLSVELDYSLESIHEFLILQNNRERNIFAFTTRTLERRINSVRQELCREFQIPVFYNDYHFRKDKEIIARFFRENNPNNSGNLLSPRQLYLLNNYLLKDDCDKSASEIANSLNIHTNLIFQEKNRILYTIYRSLHPVIPVKKAPSRKMGGSRPSDLSYATCVEKLNSNIDLWTSLFSERQRMILEKYYLYPRSKIPRYEDVAQEIDLTKDIIRRELISTRKIIRDFLM